MRPGKTLLQECTTGMFGTIQINTCFVSAGDRTSFSEPIIHGRFSILSSRSSRREFPRLSLSVHSIASPMKWDQLHKSEFVPTLLNIYDIGQETQIISQYFSLERIACKASHQLEYSIIQLLLTWVKHWHFLEHCDSQKLNEFFPALFFAANSNY